MRTRGVWLYMKKNKKIKSNLGLSSKNDSIHTWKIACVRELVRTRDMG